MASVAPDIETSGVLDTLCRTEVLMCRSENVDLHVREDK